MALDMSIERALVARSSFIVGVDEVGRGCLAGPVVAAAVELPREVYAVDTPPDSWWVGITDSKKLTAKNREHFAELIKKYAVHVRIAQVESTEIDRINILHASLLAMRQTLAPWLTTSDPVGHILVDGHINPYKGKETTPEELKAISAHEVTTVIKGDLKCLSIAAASIVAKVYRDKLMADMDGIYPGYGFKGHKGYPTPVHKQAIVKLGACPEHRRSFCLTP